MSRAFMIALCIAAIVLVPGAMAEGQTTEYSSIAFETTGLVYGLVVGSPRVSVSASIPISTGLALQVAPVAVWGGEDYVELSLPIVLRGTIMLGIFTPYVGAGLDFGLRLLAGGADSLGAGPILEVGERFKLFGDDFFIEPYVGGAVMFASPEAGRLDVTPAPFGGLRIGFGF